MWPLIEKVGLRYSYVPTMLLFYVAAYHVLNLGKSRSRIKGMFYLSVLGALGLHLAAATVKPPARYPDLYPVLISIYSCAHFGLFFLYFNYLQFSLPYFPSMLAKSKQA